MIVIGISGTNGSGKDTIAHLLVNKYGYHFASASAMFEAELIRRGLPLERENKRTLSAEWRRLHGLGVVVDKGIEEAIAAGKENLVVGSLRNSGEVDRVHELGGKVIWVDADPQVRYRRITSGDRGRVEDRKTFEQFMREQEIEMNHTGDAATLNMAAVRDNSDATIENSGPDVDVFIDQVEATLKQLGII